MDERSIDSSVSPFQFPLHDMVTLLACFLPLTGSTNTRIVYPIPKIVVLSAFSFPEPREALFSTTPPNEQELGDVVESPN